MKDNGVLLGILATTIVIALLLTVAVLAIFSGYVYSGSLSGSPYGTASGYGMIGMMGIGRMMGLAPSAYNSTYAPNATASCNRMM